MSSYPFEPSPPAQPSRQSRVQTFFRGPGLIVAVFTLAIAVWWLVSFLTPEPVPKENSGLLNYNGVAEIMDISEGPSKCHIDIKRDSGKVTRQQIARAECRKVRVGDMINYENGRYAGKIPNPYESFSPAPVPSP